MLVICAHLIAPQGYRPYQFHSRFFKFAFSSKIYLWKSHIPPYLYLTVRRLPYSFCPARESGTDCLTDLLAFLLILYLAFKSDSYGSGLLKIMAEDATLYFLIIFSSHLVLELTIIFGSVRTSSRCSVSFSFAETSVAFDKTTPWSVSDSATYLLRLFADPLSTEQRKSRVRLTRFFVSRSGKV